MRLTVHHTVQGCTEHCQPRVFIEAHRSPLRRSLAKTCLLRGIARTATYLRFAARHFTPLRRSVMCAAFTAVDPPVIVGLVYDIAGKPIAARASSSAVRSCVR